MKYLVFKLKDGRFTVRDNIYNNCYGAYKTEMEADKAAQDFNAQHQKDLCVLARCGLMLSD